VARGQRALDVEAAKCRGGLIQRTPKADGAPAIQLVDVKPRWRGG
jgi:hypothetical protein